MMRRCWIVLLVIIGLFQFVDRSGASGWKPITDQDLKLTAADIGDPEADAAILLREGELNDNNPEGTSLKVYIRIKVFTERGRRYLDVQLPYKLELGRITEVEARTIRPDGTPIEVPGRDILDKLLVKSAKGVWRAKVFSMPAVEAGSIIEYRYRQTYPQGFRYFALDLQSDLFTKELYYRIQPRSGSRLDVRWVAFNAPDPKRFAPVWDGTFKIRANNIEPFRREPLMPPELTLKIWGWLYYSDEMETDPDKYWRSYARRMQERAESETKPTEAIRRVVEALVLPGTGVEDKLGRIYRYVQTEIRNTGVGDDPAVRRNDTAEETIRRRYGTAREVNRLFIAMLRAAGFDARVAELTTRDENFLRTSFPDAFQLNGEVTAVMMRDGSIRFFDPGTTFCPPEMLSWEKEAVRALVYGRRDWRFVDTPVSEAPRNAEERRLVLTAYSDGHVEVRVDSKLTGQRALELRGELVGLTLEEQKERIAAGVRDVLPEARVAEESIVISNLTDHRAPLCATYEFVAPHLATKTEKRLLVRPAAVLHPDQSLLPAVHRSTGIYFKYPWRETEQIAINTPQGYQVEQLPDPVDIDVGPARYQARFRREGEQVIYERSLTANAITFSVSQYAAVKAFFDLVHQADRAGVLFRQL
jgi:transglutaminase-like putative cysteine protease